MSNLAIYKLSVGSGLRKTLEDWGLVDARINEVEGGDDTLTLIEGTGDFNQSAFTAFTRLEAWDEHGVRMFSGDVVDPGEEWHSGQLRVKWTVRSPLWRLTKLPYKMARDFYEDPTIDSGTVVSSDTAQVVLNRVPPGGTRTTLRAEIVSIFAQAHTGGAYVYTTAAEIPTQEMPEVYERVAKLADVLKTLGRSAPQMSMSWDYASTVQLADVRAVWRRYVPDAVGSQTGQVKIGTAKQITRTIAPLDMSGDDGLNIEPLYGLMVRTLRVQFIWRNTITSGGRTHVQVGLEQKVSTIENGAFGEEWIPIELRGATINDGEVEAEPEPVPAGDFAAWLHVAFGRLWHRAQWTVHGALCDLSVKVGEMWSLTGLGRAVAGIVLQVTHELTRGRTTVVLGPPTRITTISLALMERLRGDSPEYGRDAKDANGDEVDPTTAVQRDPFDVWVASDGDVKVQPGHVRNEEPDTVGGTADYTFSGDGEVYLKATIGSATNEMRDSSLHKAGTVPAPTSDGTYHTLYLHLATVAGATVEQWANGNQWPWVGIVAVECSGSGLSLTREGNW